MKNNINYYQHYVDSHQHPKFKMLRVKYGWSGEGRFWALNNWIGKAEDCCLNISKKYNKIAVASDLGFTLDEFDEYINYLLNDCELVKECEKGFITTDIIQENFGRVSVERLKSRKRSKRRWDEEKKSSGEEYKNSHGDACKVKESKVKEKKVKKFIPPTLETVKDYFKEKGYQESIAVTAFNYYNSNNWKDSNDKPVKSWKQKMVGVWFKDKHKIPFTRKITNEEIMA